jgi:hypothetical protein
MVAQRLIARQPNPPRAVGFGEVLWIHAGTLVYALVLLPAVAVAGVTLRAGHGLPLSDLARFLGVTYLAMVLLMAWIVLNLRNTLRFGVAAPAQILDAARTAGHLRVEINGRSVVKPYRAHTVQRFAAGDRVTVLLDPKREMVRLTLGEISGSGLTDPPPP